MDKHADRLFLVVLPTSSPKLQVIELLWKYLHCNVTHNHLIESFEKLIDAVESHLKSLDQNRDVILSVIIVPDHILEYLACWSLD